MNNQEQNNQINTIPGVYIGKRDSSFKDLISSILKKGKISKKYIEILLTPENMDKYSMAFTSELVDEYNNYQVYEQLGDLVGNQFIVWYIYRRFPVLKCAEGVKVVARLRINYGSTESFYKIAEELGFWNYITATNDLRYRKKKDLLEDVFEAFLGATASIIDDELKIGVGNAVVYQILKEIFDKIDISLSYDDLYDAKTRIKELFDIYDEQLGPLVYESSRKDNITTTNVYRLQGGKYQVKKDGKVDKKLITGGIKVLLGTGSGSLETISQQNASSKALETLKKQGYYKKPPKCYRKFMNNENKKKEINVEYIKKKYGTDINKLVKTKDKSKYQSRYQSTILYKYCRKRDIDGVRSCLQMRVDSNIKDSDLMSCLDVLFIGKTEVEKVKTIVKLLLETKCCNMEIHVEIFDNYFINYQKEDKFFTKSLVKIIK
jgi:dsRNA-specific ribonuclease